MTEFKKNSKLDITSKFETAESKVCFLDVQVVSLKLSYCHFFNTLFFSYIIQTQLSSSLFARCCMLSL